MTETGLVRFVLDWVGKVFETGQGENITEETGDVFQKLFDFVKLVVF